ncbi:uncharacterized protein F4822DRAFT_422074 [Hypoxylon trugodes]|uniref:uncharacterized protein n=1 Tax=Hypoxylon trugodes TaxID=326681 RepID=UPI00219F1110|nr:uncharacterized protein F4822DRAFT_422074 [Hypoxylon trugodes]KAI1383065.1 hypothetical protein F4822DRAFT_422074 [Hypoxylon trugodes]
MLARYATHCWAVLGLCASQAIAALCTSNLLIDNFRGSMWRRNSLGLKVGDDGTMAAITVDLADGLITFVPGRMSYFYETLPCIDTVASGYGELAFTMKGPKDSSIALEIQTTKSSTDTASKSSWRYVAGFTGELQRMTVPINSFVGANANAVNAFIWST